MSSHASRAREPILNLPPVVSACVIVMVAIHVARQWGGEEWDDAIVGLFAFAPARYLPAVPFQPVWPGGWPAAIWSPFSYALLHVDLLHLTTNCAVFASLGNVLARRLGNVRFLGFCFITSPLAALGQMLLAIIDPAPVIGVSGVICAMMGALARFAFPAERRTDESHDGEEAEAEASSARELPLLLRPVAPILETLRRPAVIRFILGFVAMNVVLVLAAPVLVGGSGGIAWMAHGAGFVAGFLLFPRLDPLNGPDRR